MEDTYNLFSHWQDDLSFNDNFSRSFHGGFRSEGWKKEIQTTLHRRFRDLTDTHPLIVLARKGYPLSDWKYCLHFWVAVHESLYGLFLEKFLYPEYQSGRLVLRTADALQYVLAAWKSINRESVALSEYGAIRTARDLLRMARDFGILVGDGPEKKFASLHFSDDLILYFCHVIAREEGSTSKIVASNRWKFLLLDQDQVHAHLLRLHQYRKLDYQIAGSIVQLTLPYATASDYAERMAA